MDREKTTNLRIHELLGENYAVKITYTALCKYIQKQFPKPVALQALTYGKTVLFTTVWDMIVHLQQSRADFSYHKRIQSYLKPDLLILDELGCRSIADRTVEDFFEIVSKRYEKGSIIITSNYSVVQWNKVFIDKTLTTAIVNRITHHSRVIEVTGESYRYENRD